LPSKNKNANLAGFCYIPYSDPHLKAGSLIRNLSFQVLVAIFLGIVTGFAFPSVAVSVKPISDIFINLIKMLIGPIIFFTVTSGISGTGSMKSLGRIGGKAIIYFEVVTTFALIIGMVVANLYKPGEGVIPVESSTEIQNYQKSAESVNWLQFFTNMVPTSVFDAFARGEILQILVFSILFGVALQALGDKVSEVNIWLNKMSAIFFRILHYVMKIAPLAAFAGIAFTIGKYGVGTLMPLANLMLSVYITMAVFIFVVLNLICRIFGFRLWDFLRHIKEEILLVLGTSSSESALPRMMEKLEIYGCSKKVVGLVIPAGYSFNLDGTTIYLSMAVIFLAQVYNVDLSFQDQLMIIGILMITSKGAAAITGGGFIVLASTLSAIKVLPVEGLAILIGVDRFMSEARAITNLIGNGVATLVISKTENEYKLPSNTEIAEDVAIN
jgi:aerobic C4-dicarboxylate transport protein